MADTAIAERLSNLEKSGTRLRWICAVQLVLLALLGLSTIHGYLTKWHSPPKILRVRGLVVEDTQGRPRILLGASFPAVAERTRQDSQTTAMVFLDTKGHDRLTLGEEPEPQVGGKVSPVLHRIASGFGIVIHDDEGNERGAYGWLDNGRALITLDRPGLDAWAAVVDDKTGFAGMRVEYAPDVARDSIGVEIGTKGSDAFLRLKDTKEKDRAVLQLGRDGATSFQSVDSRGRAERDLSRP
jgi:hypothetical protein